MLGVDQRHLDIFISTNQVNWKAIPEMPPPYRIKGRGVNTAGRKRYSERWAHFLTPAGLKPYGLKFEEVWLGKNMVWDFDHVNLSISFQDSHEVYNYLIEAGMKPTIVFSGRKGFHVWLNGDDSAKMAGVHLHDYSTNQQVVWPLSDKEINILFKEKFETADDVGRLLHPWEKEGLRYRAGNQCFRRMIANFE